jgi:hypothetical protein
MHQYTLSDIHAIRDANTHDIPQQLLDVLENLEKQLVIPTFDANITNANTTNSTANGYVQRQPNQRRHNMKDSKDKPHIMKRRPPSSNTVFDEWSSIRSFKPTVLENPKEGIEKEINEVRVYLNKLSTKNYKEQKELIMNHMKRIIAEESNDGYSSNNQHKIAQFIFDIASANKFYSELYADLYEELVQQFHIFKEILLTYVFEYKQTIDTIQYKDANKDYDGYCKYIKENDKRKAMATFLVMLTNRHVLTLDSMMDTIEYFQEALFQAMDKENTTAECEEISELLFVIISNLQFPIQSLVWEKQVLPKIETISKISTKDKTHPSLTSRAIFKHLDLMDHIKKKAVN